jgi:hypothetical protein
VFVFPGNFFKHLISFHETLYENHANVGHPTLAVVPFLPLIMPTAVQFHTGPEALCNGKSLKNIYVSYIVKH